MRGTATAGMVLLLAGCAQTADTVRVVGDSAPSFDPKQIGKSDIDRVADAHRRAIFSGVRVLAEKLYRRNPREWRKGNYPSMDAALARAFDVNMKLRDDPLGGYAAQGRRLVAQRGDSNGGMATIVSFPVNAPPSEPSVVASTLRVAKPTATVTLKN